MTISFQGVLMELFVRNSFNSFNGRFLFAGIFSVHRKLSWELEVLECWIWSLGTLRKEATVANIIPQDGKP